VEPALGHRRGPRTALSEPSRRRALRLLAGGALAAAVAALPWATRAQTGRRPARIGVLNEAWAANHPTVEGLRAGLRALGFEEGRDVLFDIRFTEGKPEATRAAAAELARADLDLLFTVNEAPTRAARAATQTRPIVFALVGDPVAANLVARRSQPGGNLTGISSLATELVPKRLEALRTLAPGIRRVLAVHYGADPSAIAAIMKAQDAARQLDLALDPRPVFSPEEVARALGDARPGDALLAPEVDTLDIPVAILEKSLEARVPAVFPTALWVGHGGLVSYGSGYHAQGVQAARLVAKILRGARPDELPVEGADRIELAVNLKTAALFGLPVPRKVLLRADALHR
jgi:putative ABC transport system substrate-binding protein